jgi:hypothetical protein
VRRSRIAKRKLCMKRRDAAGSSLARTPMRISAATGGIAASPRVNALK